MRPDDLYEPLTEDEYAQLVSDIAEHGQLTPILRDVRTGQVIAGHNRLRAMRQLGLEPVVEEVESKDDLDAVRIATSHNPTRIMRPNARRKIVGALAEAGWSSRRIASHLRVHVETIRRDAGVANATPAPERRTDKRGRAQPARKMSRTEIARFREAVQRLYDEGYNFTAIGEATDMSPSRVRDVAKELELPPRKVSPKGQSRPEPVEWRDATDLAPPPPPPKLAPPKSPAPAVPSYRMSSLAFEVERFNQGTQEDDYVKSYAWQVHEAEQAGDADWVAVMGEGLARMLRTVEELVHITTDPTYRHSVSHTAYRSTMQLPPHVRPTLHVVGDEASSPNHHTA